MRYMAVMCFLMFGGGMGLAGQATVKSQKKPTKCSDYTDPTRAARCLCHQEKGQTKISACLADLDKRRKKVCAKRHTSSKAYESRREHCYCNSLLTKKARDKCSVKASLKRRKFCSKPNRNHRRMICWCEGFAKKKNRKKCLKNAKKVLKKKIPMKALKKSTW